MTAYTIEKYLTDYVYPEQGLLGERLPSDHQDVVATIELGISTCPWEDQSVGVNDDGEKLYEDDFLDLASAMGLAGKFTVEDSPLAGSTVELALNHFIKYVEAHPDLKRAA